MKLSCWAGLVFLLQTNLLQAQKKADFEADAFLIDNHKQLTIYKDSVGSQIIALVKNIEEIDKYYRFHFLKVHGKKTKIIAKYTIDAATDDSSEVVGWINFGLVGVYINLIGRDHGRAFVFATCDKAADKIFFDTSVFSKPFEIVNVAFIKDQIWLKVSVVRAERTIIGWLSPEMQCTDIWNACVGN